MLPEGTTYLALTFIPMNVREVVLGELECERE